MALQNMPATKQLAALRCPLSTLCILIATSELDSNLRIVDGWLDWQRSEETSDWNCTATFAALCTPHVKKPLGKATWGMHSTGADRAICLFQILPPTTVGVSLLC